MVQTLRAVKKRSPTATAPRRPLLSLRGEHLEPLRLTALDFAQALERSLCPPGVGRDAFVQPVDEDLQPVRHGFKGWMHQLVLAATGQGEAAEWQDEFAALKPLLHQSRAADGDPRVIDGRQHAEVGTVEGEATRGQ